MSDRIRTTITITPEVHAIFSRMAEAGGMSLGRCIGDWLEDTSEGAQLIAQKMQEARRAPRTVMREVHALALGLADEANEVLAGLRKRPASGAAAAAAAPDAGRSEPPVSNTGGKSPKRGAGRGQRS